MRRFWSSTLPAMATKPENSCLTVVETKLSIPLSVDQESEFAVAIPTRTNDREFGWL